MKYHVNIDETERIVDVTISDDGSIIVSLDGEPFNADVIRVPGGFRIIKDQQVFDLVVGGKLSQLSVAEGPHRKTASVVSARAAGRRKKKSSAEDSYQLRAPMPGRVVKLLVSAGEKVSAGQSVVVIEAMKMENELKAVGDRVVESISVAEGASVDSGDVIVTYCQPAP